MACLIMFILISGIRNIETWYQEVETCPENIEMWNNREKESKCPQETPYHCLLQYNSSKLYEACIARRITRQGEFGCPWVSFYEGEPILGDKLSRCPSEIQGCPPSDHRGFASNQLYMYPMCYKTEKLRSVPNTSTITSTASTTTHQFNIIKIQEEKLSLTISTTVLSLALLFVVIYAVYKNYRKRRSSARGENAPTNGNPSEEVQPLVDIESIGSICSGDQSQEDRDRHESKTRNTFDLTIYKFVRTEIYANLCKMLEHNNSVWLCGIYGSGKRRTIYEYSKSRKLKMIVLNCSDRPSVYDTYRDSNILDILNIQEMPAKNILTKLRSHKIKEEKIIMIFDSVDENRAKRANEVCDSFQREPNIIFLASSSNRRTFSGLEGVFNQDNILSTDAGFAVKDMAEYFNDYADEEEFNSSLQSLGDMFDFHPLMLAHVRYLMTHMFVGLRYILDHTDDHLTIQQLQRMDRFACLISEFSTKSEPEVYEVLKSFPLFYHEDIPVKVLSSLPDVKSKDTVNLLIRLIEHLSLGKILGKDENRSINVHRTASFLLRMMTAEVERPNLVPGVLFAICCNLHNGNFGDPHGSLPSNLIKHAKETLKYSSLYCKRSNVYIFVSCAITALTISSMLNEISLSEEKTHFIQCAKIICDVFLEENPQLVPNLLEAKPGVKSLYFKERAASIYHTVEERVFSLPQATVKEQNPDIDNIMHFFQKFTRIVNIPNPRTKEKLQDPESVPKVIGKPTERELEHPKGFDEGLKKSTILKNFLAELVVKVLFRYGSMFCSTFPSGANAGNTEYYLNTAYHLAKLLTKNVPRKIPLCKMLTELNGKIELTLLRLEKRPSCPYQTLNSEEIVQVEKNIRRLTERLETECDFFDFGAYVQSNKSAEHMMICHRQLLRCYIILKRSRRNAYDKGRLREQTETLKALLEENKHVTTSPSQLAKQSLVEFHIEESQFSEALRLMDSLHRLTLDSTDLRITELDFIDIKLYLRIYKHLDSIKLHNYLEKVTTLRKSCMKENRLQSMLGDLIQEYDKQSTSFEREKTDISQSN